MQSMESMERAVLIGVDDSDHSEAAFDYYVEHLHRPRNRVTLLHVVRPYITDTNDMILPKSNNREDAMVEEKRIIKYVEDSYRAKMKTHSIPGRLSIICYCKKPGKIICEYVTSQRFSYVVIGSGAPADQRIEQRASGLGSVGDYVLKRAKCPVVIVQSRQKINAKKDKNRSLRRLGDIKKAEKLEAPLPQNFHRSYSCPPASRNKSEDTSDDQPGTSRDMKGDSSCTTRHSVEELTHHLTSQLASPLKDAPSESTTAAAAAAAAGPTVDALVALSPMRKFVPRRLSVKPEEDEFAVVE